MGGRPLPPHPIRRSPVAFALSNVKVRDNPGIPLTLLRPSLLENTDLGQRSREIGENTSETAADFLGSR
jgi:hypothetical protein